MRNKSRNDQGQEGSHMRIHSKARLWAASLAIGIALGGCSAEYRNHGYIPPAEELDEIADDIRAIHATWVGLESGEDDPGQSPQPVQGSDGDRYHVLDELGHGGMGVVLDTWDRRLRRRLAMKVARAGTPTGPVASR